MQYLNISRERFEVVHREISEGSEPALRFYLLVTVATLIAGFGLIADSTAVVIGAMLVAPLMTPIFGVSLALVRGEANLLGRALRAEIVGVTLAVAMSFVLGLLLGDFEATVEMMSRTRPTLLDLLVAVLAGFAGAYALVDEKISPALPGVAIATAIVPPLANAGLCLALGEVTAAMGSFLLFFTNFLSILVVASLTFLSSGMAKRFGIREADVDLVRRFRLPVIAFLLIAAFLGHSLFVVSRERRMGREIRETLIDETSRLPGTVLLEAQHYLEEEGHMQVVARVGTPAVLTPAQVSGIQNELAGRIGVPTELIVRCVLSTTVSALGSVRNTIEQNLDGTFTRSSGSDNIDAIATTEQVVREYLAADPSLDLNRVEYVPYGPRRLMLAHVIGLRPLTWEETGRLQADVRQATGDDDIELIVSHQERIIITTDGTFRYGWFLGSRATPETRERLLKVRADLTRLFERDDAYALLGFNANHLDDGFEILLEVAGPGIYPRLEVEQLQARLARELSEPVALYVHSRVEVIHGPKGPRSIKELDQYFRSRQKENLPQEVPAIPGAFRK